MSRVCQATEKRGFDAVLADFPRVEVWTETLLRRVRAHMDLGSKPRVLDIGAAQGSTVLALRRAGCDAVGVEPWEGARAMSGDLARGFGLSLEIHPAAGEDLPFSEGSFDLAICVSTIEHVEDPQRVFAEAHRVLRPGGALYVKTWNRIHPTQDEIRRFPLFPWYPNRFQRRILGWAAERHPALVGRTETPAMHWFSTRTIARDLHRAGFGQIIDRWALRLADEESGVRRSFMQVAKRNRIARLFGDLLISGLAVLAVKSDSRPAPGTRRRAGFAPNPDR